MPKRSPSHKAESASERAFDAILPLDWVPRKPTPDYGIDREVEIFDEQGNSTGRKFLVQLKANDNAPIKKALSLSIKIEALEYYRSLEEPVLIVRFHSATGSLYARWSHTVDLYYSKPNAKTVTVKFLPKDLITADNIARLDSEVRAFRDLRASQTKYPLTARVRFEEDVVHGLPAALLAIELRKAAACISSYIELKGDSVDVAHVDIKIGNNEAAVYMANGGGFVLHTSKGTDIATLVSDVMIGMAISLSRVGKLQIAASIVKYHYASCSLVNFPDKAFLIVDPFIEGRMVMESLDISSGLLEKYGLKFEAQLFMLPALFCRDSLSEVEDAKLRSLLVRLIEVAKQDGSIDLLATAYYNLGRYFRSHRRFLEAIEYYKLAARTLPTYISRKYFNSEIGGILFLCGKYRWSAHFYRKAVDGGATGLTLALFADALMHAGEYGQAVAVLKRYLDDGECRNKKAPYWRLLIGTLEGIIKSIDAECQTRRPFDALTHLQCAVEGSCPDVPEVVSSALQLDAICASAWSILGHHMWEHDNPEAFSPLLVSAVCDPHTVERWVDCLLHELTNNVDEQMIYHVMWAAYTFHGDTILTALVQEIASKITDSNIVAGFANSAEALIDAIPKWKETIELRLSGGELDDYYTILMNDGKS